jgi:hypothetical protein
MRKEKPMELPTPLAKLLLALVDVAERDQVCTLRSTSCASTDEDAWDITIHSSKGDDVVIRRLPGAPIESLQRLGFLERVHKGNLFLYPAAFEQAKYERKTRLGKWLARTLHRGRDAILAISFTLTILLTVLKIIEISKTLTP